MKKCKVLVTGSTAPGFVSIVKSLKSSRIYDMEVIGSDYQKNLSSEFYVDECFVLPDNRSPKFSGALLDLCEEKNVDVILPIRTDDQLPLCNKYGAFKKKGIEPALVVTSPKLLDTILNKRRLMEYTKNVIGIETPEFSYATSAKDFEKAVESLGYPEKRVVIKPSYSNGSRGFRILDGKLDLKNLFFNEKPTGIFTTLPRVLEDIGETFPELIAMEYLPGKEYTIDTLCRKGNTFSILPRLRTRMTGGITTQGVLSRDANSDKIEETAEKLVEGFGLSYNVGIQVKENAAGIPMLLEINPRLQGTTVISVAGGVNIPELMVMMALEEFDYDYKPDVKWGLEMQRVWLELFSYEGRTWEFE